jgi:hypothetical protein
MCNPRRVGRFILLLAIPLAVSLPAHAQAIRYLGDDYYDPLGYPGYYGPTGYRSYLFRGLGYYRIVPPAIENPRVITLNRGTTPEAQQPSMTSPVGTDRLETLLEKAESLFADPGNIVRCARETRDLVRKAGQLADTTQIIAGAVALAERSHNPTAQGKGTAKLRFADYCNQYLDWRCRGKSHQEAIAQIDGRGRF